MSHLGCFCVIIFFKKLEQSVLLQYMGITMKNFPETLVRKTIGDKKLEELETSAIHRWTRLNESFKTRYGPSMWLVWKSRFQGQGSEVLAAPDPDVFHFSATKEAR